MCIVNASPLMLLARGGHIGLLQECAEQVQVPKAVAEKKSFRRGPTDTAVRALQTHDWIRIIGRPQIPPVIMPWGLGPGESEVLAEALSRPGTHAVIDDLAAWRCAASLGVPVNGTLGLVLRAKKCGLWEHSVD